MGKVYKEYCFSKDYQEKHESNGEYLKELKERVKPVKVPNPGSGEELTQVLEENPDAGLIYYLVTRGYTYNTYRVIKKNMSISDDELMLIISNNELMFGGKVESNRVIIYTD